jgi:hypothetical protein
MRKCPGCAEENIYESLFCKHCGRCLLAPDPEEVRWSIATAAYTEPAKTSEGIDFDAIQIVKNSRVAWLQPRQQTAPAVFARRLLLLNLLAFLLIIEIVRYIFAD